MALTVLVEAGEFLIDEGVELVEFLEVYFVCPAQDQSDRIKNLNRRVEVGVARSWECPRQGWTRYLFDEELSLLDVNLTALVAIGCQEHSSANLEQRAGLGMGRKEASV